MQRATAIKRLAKILGKSLGYRVDPDAPSREEREAASAAFKVARDKAEALLKAKEARIKTLLDADGEFQRIKAEHEAAKQDRNRLAGEMCRYKFTVGTSDRLFFHVKAQGDSWEEILEKLKA